MSSKHQFPVEVVRVRFLPAGVVGSHQEAVEVLVHRYNCKRESMVLVPLACKVSCYALTLTDVQAMGYVASDPSDRCLEPSSVIIVKLRRSSFPSFLDCQA